MTARERTLRILSESRAAAGLHSSGSTSRGRWKTAIAGPHALRNMFLVALAIRIAVSAVMVPEFLDPFRDHWHFGWEMGRIARSIWKATDSPRRSSIQAVPRRCCLRSTRYLVALCMQLFGGFTVATTMAVLTLNSIFASLTVIPMYFLAKRVLDEHTALVAGWAWVFFPYSIYLAGGRIYSDALTCLVASLLWLQTLRLEKSRALGIGWFGELLWGAGRLGESGVAGTSALPCDMAGGAARLAPAWPGLGREFWPRVFCWPSLRRGRCATIAPSVVHPSS